MTIKQGMSIDDLYCCVLDKTIALEINDTSDLPQTLSNILKRIQEGHCIVFDIVETPDSKRFVCRDKELLALARFLNRKLKVKRLGEEKTFDDFDHREHSYLLEYAVYFRQLKEGHPPLNPQGIILTDC